MNCKARLSCILMVGALFVAGCGGSTAASESNTSAATTTQAPSNGEATADAANTKVSANTASDSEIEAALAAAGVSNAGRWAHEVVEYRPYPSDDPNLQKLRD